MIYNVQCIIYNMYIYIYNTNLYQSVGPRRVLSWENNWVNLWVLTFLTIKIMVP